MKKKIIDESNWFLAESDFEIEDEAYESTRPYKIWFELLKIHPGITALYDKKCNPSDFSSDLIKVYDDFRMEEVFNDQLLFKDWWWKYGQHLFSSYLNKEGLQIIAAVPEGESNEYAEKNCHLGIKNHLDIHRSQSPLEGFLVMTISLSSDKKQIKRLFDKVISYHLSDVKNNPTPKATVPRYKLLKNIQLDTINMSLKLLHRAIDLHDEKKQWKIGFDAGVFESGTANYSYETLPQDKKENLIQATSREFKRAKYLLENASLGRFPCFDSIDSKSLDFKEIFDFRNSNLKLEKQKIKKNQKDAYKLKSQKNITNYNNIFN